MNHELELVEKPWWTNHAMETNRGICVARAHVYSSERYKQNKDMFDLRGKYVGRDYSTGTTAEFDGDRVLKIMDLTYDDAISWGLDPKDRPKSNRDAKPLSQSQLSENYNALQEERVIPHR